MPGPGSTSVKLKRFKKKKISILRLEPFLLSWLGFHDQLRYGFMRANVAGEKTPHLSPQLTASGRPTDLVLFRRILSSILVSLTQSFSTSHPYSWSITHSEWPLCWIMSTRDCRWLYFVCGACHWENYRLSLSSRNPTLRCSSSGGKILAKASITAAEIREFSLLSCSKCAYLIPFIVWFWCLWISF